MTLPGLPPLGSLSIPDLIRLHRSTLSELFRRNVVRTMNAPQGDWAEYLVAVAYEGARAANSEKSWDVAAADGRRLQVKSRVLDPDNVGSNGTSPFRSWDFSAAVIVLFDSEDLSVLSAAELPVDTIRELATYRKHVNGHVFRPSKVNLAHGTDVTELLRRTAASLGG